MAHLTATGRTQPIAPPKAAAFFPTKPVPLAVVEPPQISTIPPETIRAGSPKRQRAIAVGMAGISSSPVDGKRYYAQGVTKVGGSPVSRFVRIRRKDTGGEITSGYSGADGRFHLSWADYSGMVEVTIYDDAASLTPYNAKIFDFVVTS